MKKIKYKKIKTLRYYSAREKKITNKELNLTTKLKRNSAQKGTDTQRKCTQMSVTLLNNKQLPHYFYFLN